VSGNPGNLVSFCEIGLVPLALLLNLRPESPAAMRDKVGDLLVFRMRMFCIPLTEAAYVTVSVQVVSLS
jgi:hypothetical protein